MKALNIQFPSVGTGKVEIRPSTGMFHPICYSSQSNFSGTRYWSRALWVAPCLVGDSLNKK